MQMEPPMSTASQTKKTFHFTIPATRFTRTIQFAVSPKAVSLTIVSKQGNEPPFIWCVALAPFAFTRSHIIESNDGGRVFSFGRHWMFIRNKSAA
jgi:hypothetical protein